MQRLPGAVCHKDVRAVKDSAIVLRADRVETLDAEPTAFGPEKKEDVSVCAVEISFNNYQLKTFISKESSIEILNRMLEFLSDGVFMVSHRRRN